MGIRSKIPTGRFTGPTCCGIHVWQVSSECEMRRPFDQPDRFSQRNPGRGDSNDDERVGRAVMAGLAS